MNMYKMIPVFLFSFLLAGAALTTRAQAPAVVLFPANGAVEVNVDTRLILKFASNPVLNNKGKIRIYDASNGKLVDELDMSIPPGPKNTRTLPAYEAFKYASMPDTVYTVKFPDTVASHIYQKNYIGGSSEADAYHFYPVIIRDNAVIICPHNNRLAYNSTYYVEIEEGLLSLADGSFTGIKGKTTWRFRTKAIAPSLKSGNITVAADGSGDFSTVQAAIDFMPEKNEQRKTIFIKNGTYDEIVYFRNKDNLSIIGEQRGKTVICYANNGVFNTKLMSPDPASAKGSHNIRAVLAVNNADGLHLANLTLRSLGEKPAQAEALLVQGQQIIVNNVDIEGSGDALQASGTIYITNSKIQGYGDNVLGYGAVFFNECDFVSTFGPHLWVRNTKANHGNVLYNCTLRTIGDVQTTIARAPNSGGQTYPFVEAVLLNCKMEGIRPEGWGQVADDPKEIKYWEFNSTQLEDGKPIDISKRHPASRQLTMEKDAQIIQQYSDPAFTLNGWQPRLEKLLQP